MSKFYFSIIDDTDDATYENIKPIYDFLYEKGILITKTVWVYPVLDKYSSGDSLERKEYADYIVELSKRGYEIGLHNVGSADYDSPYTRDKILTGLEKFREILGYYPRICVNHSYNPDSIYGGYKRFNFPFSFLVKKMYPQYGRTFYGEVEGSPYFWGDKYKELFKYSRNHECNNINTIAYDKYMPYIDPKRSKYANYWYSATFAPNPKVFNYLVTPCSIAKLEESGGCCIIFTHLGYYYKNGKIDPGFVERINMLANNPSGVYMPITKTLDTIAQDREYNGGIAYPTIPLYMKFIMELKHLLTRLKFRKIIKIDDYAFKSLKKEMFIK